MDIEDIKNIDEIIEEPNNFILMSDYTLNNIFSSDTVEFKQIFTIISYLDNERLYRILYYSDFYDNTIVLSAILISLLNDSNKLFDNLYDNPYCFMKHYSTMVGCINRLKEIYICLYNENIKCLCFRKTFNSDFVNILQNNYFNFNITLLLSKFKNLTLTLEYIFKNHKEYYDVEQEHFLQCYPNQEQAMHYQEIFDNFAKNYNKKIKRLNIVNSKKHIDNINNVLLFLF